MSAEPDAARAFLSAMTLRLLDDSLRLRLSPDEVRQLREAGTVEAATHVGPGAVLRYAVRAADVDRLAARFDGATLAVLVPRERVAAWARGDVGGVEGTQDAGGGRTLAILAETDLGCDHDRPRRARDTDGARS